MKVIWPPQDEVFWYLNRDSVSPCRENLEVDVAIVGGGMAGLSAAQAFRKRGKKVALFEQYYCGSGASGKSSGFITPNAELSCTDLARRYNLEIAKQLWDFITSGVEDIRKNISEFNIACDYSGEDTIVLANNKKDLKELIIECENLNHIKYEAFFYDKKTIKDFVGTDAYYGGLKTGGSFGINGYQYCQAMKEILQKNGVLVFEETPVLAIHDHTLKTLHATINAEYIIIAADRFIPDLGFLKHELYHVQTFLLASQQLTESQIRAIFPQKNSMAWDTDFIYTYFRITGDKRLLVGGGSMLTTYASQEMHAYKPMIKKLTDYFFKRFPHISVHFEQCWPGFIGISKDIAPIAGRDKEKKHIYYIAAAAGLPIAAALGRYSAEHIIDKRTDLDSYFSPYRAFPIRGFLQSLLGKKISFALSNLITKKFS